MDSGIRQCGLAFLTSRLLVWIAGGGAYLAVGTRSPGQYDFLGITGHLGRVGNVAAAPVARWDAIWYLHIAQAGYTHRRDAAFFPVYPLLVRAAGFLTRSDIAGAALVSLVAFFAALLVLHRLTVIELGAPAAARTVLLISFFPTAMFFSAGYTEALFFALSVGVFLAAREQRWALVGMLGAAAAASRTNGVLLLVPAAIFYLYGPRGRSVFPEPDSARRQLRDRLRPRYALRRDALWLLAIPAGLGAWLIASQLIYGDAFASWHAEALFARGFAGPLSSVWRGFGDAFNALSSIFGGHPSVSGLRKLALLATALGALALLIPVFRRLPLAYGAYGLVALIAALSTPIAGHPLAATPRYIVVVFPIFMWMGWRLTARAAMWLVLCAFAAGLVYCAAMFSTWHFVA